jgi:hypothetical protein
VSEVTVITASLPDRVVHREECIRSVATQIIAPADHLIAIDYQKIGGWRPRNILASQVKTKWTQILDDDDLLLPHHIATMLDHSEDADVVYSYPTVIGAPTFDSYNRPFDPDLLRKMSIVSHVAMVRTELIIDLGGFDDVKGYDYQFWLKALNAGAKFVSVPETTWIYRLNNEWVHESRS